MERTCRVTQPEVRPAIRDIGDQHTDVVEVGWTSTMDRIKGSDSHLQQYPLTYSYRAPREELA